MSDIDFDELDRAVNGALGTEPDAQNTPEELPLEVPERAETAAITPVERTRMDPTLTPAPVQSAPAAKRSSGRFMDVIHPSSDMRTAVADRPVVAKPEAKPIEDAETVPEAPAWNEPLESPFLPDTKVEKRPLGGAPAEAPTPDPFDFQGLLDEPKDELIEAPESQELLEATTMPDPIDFAEAHAAKEEVEAEPESTPEPTTPELQPEEPAQQPPKEITEEPTGPTSITQQYKEQPTTPQESGAIYDTESYHQPVSQPPKKPAGWLVFVWIGLLILLGAGAGWAVYTYVLPML